jgi:hypothetical protein
MHLCSPSAARVLAFEVKAPVAPELRTRPLPLDAMEWLAHASDPLPSFAFHLGHSSNALKSKGSKVAAEVFSSAS